MHTPPRGKDKKSGCCEHVVYPVVFTADIHRLPDPNLTLLHISRQGAVSHDHLAGVELPGDSDSSRRRRS